MIPFNRPHLTQRELGYIAHAHSLGALSGDGPYTRKCHQWIEGELNVRKALLTHSCTAALEMMAILSNIQPGDEVIIPSYTFVSTANAFVLRGAVPVFVDVRSDTFNLDESLIESAITPRTRAIIPVHYAGIGCEMDSILEIASKHNLKVFEDAAQGTLAQYKGRELGSIGHLGAFSFHETKNIISGEGGALLVNDPEYAGRAEIIREKGTNRSQFFRGQVDKYTWVDIGSSYLPGEVVAAFLFAQLEFAREITKRRLTIWDRYHEAFAGLESQGLVRRPIVPDHCQSNAHMYFLITENIETRTRMINHLKQCGIMAVFHYIPLHSSPAGLKYGRYVGEMNNTNHVSDTLLRLPLFADLTEAQQDEVINAVKEFYT
jgi:dTDP-4-amino-4,6-dideoxygalactose transaminase